MTIRYAPYIEEQHQDFLRAIYSYRTAVADHSDSPYKNYNPIEIEDAFFGVGYTVSSFPSLYDMYGKFMAGLDVDTLYKAFFGDLMGASEFESATKAERALVDDELSTLPYPKFLCIMRDLNAVVTSSFIIGKIGIEKRRIKLLMTFSSSLKYKLLSLSTQKWTAYLNFKKTVLIDQAFLLKLYISTKMLIDEVNYNKILQHYLWPFTVLNYERSALAAMQSAKLLEKHSERSDLSKGLLIASYTVQGAIIGSYFPSYGTYIGAVVGFIVGVAIVLLE